MYILISILIEAFAAIACYGTENSLLFKNLKSQCYVVSGPNHYVNKSSSEVVVHKCSPLVSG